LAQYAWTICQYLLEIAQSKKVLDILEMFCFDSARAFQAINFYTGTQQPVHAHSIHFGAEPFGCICREWVALERRIYDRKPR
jgi:hypothetical protein